MLAMQGAIASERALVPDERPKRLREGWASRSDVRMARGACDAQGCANGAGRMDAPERRCAAAAYPPSAIRYPLSASLIRRSDAITFRRARSSQADGRTRSSAQMYAIHSLR
jgi:hypothetical protein